MVKRIRAILGMLGWGRGREIRPPPATRATRRQAVVIPTDPVPAEEGHVDPQTIAEDGDRRVAAAQAALDDLSRAYHEGTLPLTVARAKVGVMQRTDRGMESDWKRKPS